jgi:hypothetical protein
MQDGEKIIADKQYYTLEQDLHLLEALFQKTAAAQVKGGCSFY